MKKNGILIVKRDGTKESYQEEKINKILEWATEGISGVNAVDIAMASNLTIFDGMTSSEIHQTLIDSAADMISEETPNYSKVAARLYNFMLRKEAWGGKNPPKLYDLIKQNVDYGLYDPEILNLYSRREIDKINETLDHNRDDYFEYGGILQMREKYLIQNRKTKEVHETPQFLYILTSMVMAQKEDPSVRLKWIKDFYEDFSHFRINIATPILAGARSKTRSYSSCCLIDVEDTKQSLFAANTTVGMVTCDRYGIGLNLGNIRPLNSPIKNGDTLHSGVIPWLKMYQDTVHACQQGGARRGAGTVTFPIFHPEIMTILELKNNQGTHENRVPHLDYSISISQLFYDRLKNRGKISLFSSCDAPKVYDSFGKDEFDQEYLLAEQSNIPRIEVDAIALFTKFFTERVETNRIYCVNIDEANTNSPWKETVRISNLCVAGDQRVISNKGILTAEELYEDGGDLLLFDNQEVVTSSKMELIEKNAKTFKITLENGMSHTITDYHKVATLTKDEKGLDVIENKECKNLRLGDKVLIQTKEGLFGLKDMKIEAFLLGLFHSYNNQYKSVIEHHFVDNNFDLKRELRKKSDELFYKYGCDELIDSKYSRLISGKKLTENEFYNYLIESLQEDYFESKILKHTFNFAQNQIPQWLWESDQNSQLEYFRGLLRMNQGEFNFKVKKSLIRFGYINDNLEFLKNIQILFTNLGFESTVKIVSKKDNLPLTKEEKVYFKNDSWQILVNNKESKKIYSPISTIKLDKNQDVFCCKVNTDRHHWICNGFVTHNCQEILHPLKAERFTNDPEAEIGVCILGAINMLKIKSDKQHKKVCRNLVRFLDNIIDIQEYSVKACENFAKNKRSLGVGITNFAAWLASKHLNHNSPEALQETSDFMEKQQYYLMEASIELAKERGAAPHFEKSKYYGGELSPLDLYNKNVDKLLNVSHKLDWDELKNDIKKYGIRNMTLSAVMPCESSSVVQSSTNGVEPITSLISRKTSLGKTTIQVAPKLEKYKNIYLKKKDIKNNDGIIKINAVISKWLCMSISFNLYYDRMNYEDHNIPLSVLVRDHLYASHLGIKTFYYCNNRKSSDSLEELIDENQNKETEEVEISCAGGACSL